MTVRRRRCVNCNLLTTQWQRINGSPWHCFDGCHSTTGRDRRTIDGDPAWLPYRDQKAWAPARMWSEFWKRMEAESAERNALLVQKAQAVRDRRALLQRERRAANKLLLV